MKFLTKLLSLFASVTVILSCLVFTTNAANTGAVLHFPKNAEAGKDVTISVTIKPGVKMYAVSFYLKYDENILKFKSGSGAENNAGVVKVDVVESPAGKKDVTYDFTFTALKGGTSLISVSDCKYALNSGSGAKTQKFGGASANLTVKDASLSSNTKLKSLSIGGYAINPAFSPDKYSYTAEVPYNINEVIVTAETEDSGAKIKSVEGNKKLKVGSNTVTVTVEAANGTTKKYTIKVTRAKEGEQTDIGGLQTTIGNDVYIIASVIPQDIIFKDFKIEIAKVNGYDIQTAVDKNGNFRIFYLKAPNSTELKPFLYDAEQDIFEEVKYLLVGENYYIFNSFPEDYTLPKSLYASTVKIGDFEVECFADSSSSMDEFYYVYAFSSDKYDLYRYDSVEGTIQRYPDFANSKAQSDNEGDGIFDRFASLSTNGKVIMIALTILIIGILLLLVLLIIHFVKKSINRPEDFVLDDPDDFDEIEVDNDYKF